MWGWWGGTNCRAESPPPGSIGERPTGLIFSWATAHVLRFALFAFLVFRVPVAVTTKFSQRKPLLRTGFLRLRGLIVARAAFLANEGDLNPLLVHFLSGFPSASRPPRYSMILEMTPAPMVRPPSRIAKRCFSSIAAGVMRLTFIFTLSPGITIFTSSGSSILPVTSNVRM